MTEDDHARFHHFVVPRVETRWPAVRCHRRTRRTRRHVQSTATAKAAQISRIRASDSRPSRWTRTAIETLSMESRFTAVGRGTGSWSGSRRTSLASPRTVVVQGATSARRCRGITASRDSTTAGRRPISASSHHQTSPRAGTSLMRQRLPAAMTPGRPTHPARRPGARRTRRSWHQPQRIGDGPAMLEVPHRRERRQCSPPEDRVHCRGVWSQPWCSSVSVPCHEYATRSEMRRRGSACGDG
jgi:hypothetical protein